jgi:hypothetical protein
MPDFMPTSGVYALTDPRTNRVMYVGQSIDIDYRYRQHLDLMNGRNTKIYNFISQLSREDLTPRLIILAKCGVEDMDRIEREAIAHYHGLGQCELNQTSLGLGNQCVSKAGASSRDDWFLLGRKYRYTIRLLSEIAQETGRLCGAGMMDRVLRINSKLLGLSEVFQDAIRSKYGFDRDLLDAFRDWRRDPEQEQ